MYCVPLTSLNAVLTKKTHGEEEMINKTNTTFESKLWQEQFNAMDRAFKLEERKCIFVVALFGAGGISSVTGASDDFAYLYFLIPLVAIAFDVLILSQKYSVRRIGYFLCKNSCFDLERGWESFVGNHREQKVHIGTEIFTIISFAASFVILFKFKYHEDIGEVPALAFIWFGLLLTMGAFSKFSRHLQISNLYKD